MRLAWVLFMLVASWAVLSSRLDAAQDTAKPRDLTKVPSIGEEDGESRWAVVVGISKYQGTIQDLEFSDNDARAFGRALVTHCGFKEDHIKLLINEQATAKNIRTALGTWLPAVARRNDLVAIYFSGHGAPDVDEKVSEDGIRKYLITHDTDPSDLFGTAVPMDDLGAALMRLRSERTVILIDSCYSGAVLPAGAVGLPRTFHRPNVEVEGKLQVGFIDTLARSGRGRAVLTASRPNERSWEFRDLQHGVFTYHVLQGLAGRAAADTVGEVTVTSLYEYVYRQLTDPGSHRPLQTPMLATSVAGTIILAGKDIRQQQPGSGQGKVRLLTSPLGADVIIGRDPVVRRTPADIELPSGFHQIALYKPGYIPRKEEIYVEAGRTRTIPPFILAVEESLGDLYIVATAGTQVSVDGTQAGIVSAGGLLRIPDVQAGSRKVALTLEGSVEERDVIIKPGAPTIERFTLERQPSGMRRPGNEDTVPGLQFQNGRYVWQRDGSEMVFVSEGPFLMGRDEEAESRPRRVVVLPAFWIDRTEVSNVRFAHFVRQSGYRPTGGWTPPPDNRASRPATRVSLADAQAYAAWAGKVLPTETQWEKAARGTDGRIYPYGTMFELKRQNVRAFGLGDAMDCGSIPDGASPYGALDMLGNVWEWCNSLFAPYPGNSTPVAAFGSGSYVLRGGSYLTPALQNQVSLTARVPLRSTIGQQDVGFRCVAPLNR